MTVEEFSKELYEAMDARIQSEAETLEGTRNVCSMVLQAVSRLKHFITDYTFADKKEEINFFKNIKPKFVSRLIHYQRIFKILSDVPLGLSDDIHQYYLNQFQKITNYIVRHKDFFIYYKSGSVLFDEIYFVRKEPDLWLSLTGDCEQGSFSTVYDQTLSKLLAYEEVASFLMTAINTLQPSGEGFPQASSVTWTGSKAALIELLYAVQTSGVCNNGAIDVKQLANHFEHLFNVKLGNFYRTFQEIRIRKISRTHFLDQLKENLIQRMDNSDEHPRF